MIQTKSARPRKKLSICLLFPELAFPGNQRSVTQGARRASLSQVGSLGFWGPTQEFVAKASYAKRCFSARPCLLIMVLFKDLMAGAYIETS
jgi:hypothetical protein